MHVQPVPWIGPRIRQFRQKKGMTQMDIGRTTGMRSAYISRVETGKTVPSVESMERFASALGVPLYQFFLDPGGQDHVTMAAGDSKMEGFLLLLNRCVHGMSPADRAMVLRLAKRLAGQS